MEEALKNSSNLLDAAQTLPLEAYTKNVEKTWYQREKWKMDKLCCEFGWERKHIYHMILEQISIYYNLEYFKQVYIDKYGKDAKYNLDLINEYQPLQKIASLYLDFLLDAL